MYCCSSSSVSRFYAPHTYSINRAMVMGFLVSSSSVLRHSRHEKYVPTTSNSALERGVSYPHQLERAIATSEQAARVLPDGERERSPEREPHPRE
jgi:hypothetical protein